MSLTRRFMDSAGRLNWSHELRLVAQLSRGFPTEQAGSEPIRELVQNRPDWETVKTLAQRHRVAALIADTLGKHAYPQIPEHVTAYFDVQLKRHMLRSLQTSRTTIQVFRALEKAGIPAMVMKGPAIAERFYNKPAARQAVDTDIIIPPQHLPATRQVIKEIGFTQAFPDFEIPPSCIDMLMSIRPDMTFQRESDNMQLELHWRWTRNPLLLDWSWDEAMRFTTIINLANSPIRVLETPPLLIFLICHGSKHGWFRLKWLLDIERILAQLTARETALFIELAERFGAERMIASTLRLIGEIYAPPVNEQLVAAFQRAEKSALTSHMHHMITRDAKQTGIRLSDLARVLSAGLYELRLRRGWRYRLWVLLRYTVDVRDIAVLQLPRKWLWVYVMLGPVLSLLRAAKLEWRNRKNLPKPKGD